MTVDNTRIELVMENVSTFAFLRSFFPEWHAGRDMRMDRERLRSLVTRYEAGLNISAVLEKK